MQATLCIIDMQPKYEASKQVINQVCREVRRAKKNGDGIVVLEYLYGGEDPTSAQFRTYKKIMKTIGDYKNAYVEYKCDDDGSREVVNTIRGAKFPSGVIRVCGVNRYACVISTVEGLVEMMPDSFIEVIDDAISSPDDWYEATGYGEGRYTRAYFSGRVAKM
jgi:hypothetical protein